MFDRIRDLLIGEQGGTPPMDDSNLTGKGTWRPQQFKGTTAARGMTPAQVDAAEAKKKEASSKAVKARLAIRRRRRRRRSCCC